MLVYSNITVAYNFKSRLALSILRALPQPDYIAVMGFVMPVLTPSEAKKVMDREISNLLEGIRESISILCKCSKDIANCSKAIDGITKKTPSVLEATTPNAKTLEHLAKRAREFMEGHKIDHARRIKVLEYIMDNPEIDKYREMAILGWTHTLGHLYKKLSLQGDLIREGFS